ncbi:MAG TPA: hypothetical protein VHO25_14520, partial [Polyangiaceae bacterium]|nr:hypothetical protein [Polyangiaceae bacterium]
MTTPTTAEELVKALQQRVHNSMTGWEGDPLSMGEAVALVNAYTATKRTSPAGLDHPSQLHRADDTITVELWYPEAG